MEPTYHIRLLGPLQIEKFGVPLPPLRTQKTSALLAYLIRRAQPVSRSHLADLFWPDNTEERGRRNLSNELSHLSAQLPNAFESDRQTIHFQPTEDYWIDTKAFERLISPPSVLPSVAKGGEALLSSPQWGELEGGNLVEATNLYRGDFLGGVTLSDCPEFETWLYAEQEYWRQQVSELLDRLVNHHLQRGDETQAQDYARRMLVLEPWREEAHRYLMILLARSGQRSAALAQYETCRRVLAEELDVEPSLETTDLYEQIRVGSLSRSSTAPWNRGTKEQQTAEEIHSSAPQQASTSASLSRDRRNQLILLDKVKSFWVNGVQEQSLKDMARIDLARQLVPEAIEQPWEQIVEPLVNDAQPIPPEKTMLDLFYEADRALLILGAPGVGKTISLIDLARELIALAEYDHDQPIPVILNLSSWSKRRGALAGWVVEELTAKYQIPHKMGQLWLENNELLLLLDGFDEIAPKYQTEGIKAINQFREAHGLTGLVVCSRFEDYEAVPLRLRLGGAIRLQPLSLAQIDAYLAEAGPQLEFLRVVLQREAEHGGTELRDVLESPLMLSVFKRAYQESDTGRVRSESKLVLSANQDKATRRHHLFAAYVQRMLQRRGGKETFPASQTEEWLIWLAQKMFQHNQTVFLIEQLQPSWLSTCSQRWLYLLAYRLAEALGIAMLIWALASFWQENAPRVASSGIGLVAGLFPLPTAYADLMAALLVAVVLSLLVAVMDGFYFEWIDRHDDASGWIVWRHLVVAGVAAAIPIGVILLLSPGSFWEALYWGTIGGAGFGVLSYLVHGQSFQNSMQSAERLKWSWSGAVKWTLAGLIPGLLFQFITSQLDAFFAGTMVLWILSFFLIGGLQGRDVETKNAPNQGIRLSARNSTLTAALGALIYGGAMWYLSTPFIGLLHGLAAGMILGLFYGGSNVIKHFLIRLLLWANDTLPWSYVRFLDYAAERILLRKVGGGYIFMHRLLQAYFANLADTASSNPASSQPAEVKEQTTPIVTQKAR